MSIFTIEPPLEVHDEGVSLGSATTLDFVGDAVTATVLGATATITVTGGSGNGNVDGGAPDSIYPPVPDTDGGAP